MSYRFVKITSFYRNFLYDFYSRKKDLYNKNYNDHLEELMNEGFGWSNFFQLHLRELGVDAYEIIYNAEALQNKWAEEHGVSETGEALLLTQLKYLKPAVIFFQDSLSLSEDFLKNLDKEIPSLKKMIGWCCSPFTDEQLNNFKYFDFSFVCSEKFLEIFQKKNLKVYELNHAFESSLLPKIKVNNINPETDFIFVGSFILNPDFHDERLRIIEALIKENIKIIIHANFNKESYIKLKSRQAGYLLSKTLGKYGMKSFVTRIEPLKKSYLLKSLPKKQYYSKEFLETVSNKTLFGIEMLKALSRSKIGFNSHGGVAGDFAANSRMFEVTGVGSCLLNDNKKNITKFFEPGKEIVTYNSVEDCVEKVKWLLNNPIERTEIANSGQKRTIKDHSFQKRAEFLNEIILKEMKTS